MKEIEIRIIKNPKYVHRKNYIYGKEDKDFPYLIEFNNKGFLARDNMTLKQMIELIRLKE